jgi:hypothetical protein
MKAGDHQRFACLDFAADPFTDPALRSQRNQGGIWRRTVVILQGCLNRAQIIRIHGTSFLDSRGATAPYR